MSQDSSVNSLVINTLTTEQFEQIQNPSSTELYFVTDGNPTLLEITAGLGYVPQSASNLVTTISASSTDAQYPSAKCVYDLLGNIEAALQEINGQETNGD